MFFCSEWDLFPISAQQILAHKYAFSIDNTSSLHSQRTLPPPIFPFKMNGLQFSRYRHVPPPR